MATPATDTPVRTTDQDNSAKAIIDTYLDSIGLGGLGDWAWQRYLDTGSTDLTMLELRQRPEYKQRFAGKLMLAEKGRTITEAEQIQYEQQAAGLMRAAGFPPSFYDQPSDFMNLVGNDVSLSELGSRINDAYVRVINMPTAVRSTFAEWYGAGSDAALATLALDYNKALPSILHTVASGEVGGELARQGMVISRDLAEEVSKTTADTAAIRAAAGQVGGLYASGLFGERQGEQDLSVEAGVRAAFSNDQAFQRDVQRRIQERQATTKGNAESTLSTQQGVKGAGSAPET